MAGANTDNRAVARVGLAIGALVASAVAFVIAPLVLADSYSWVEHTTSESGAQGVGGAWLARAGFLLFGFAVLWIVHLVQREWGQPATVCHTVFGVCMVSVAAFSLRSWEPNVDFDATEDLLHSAGATMMGFAFALGVVSVAIRIRRNGGRWRLFDVVAVLASVVLPIWMGLDGSIDGLLQRLMFLIAYLWFGREVFGAHARSIRDVS